MSKISPSDLAHTPRAVSLTHAAAMISISVGMLNDLIKSGQGPKVRRIRGRRIIAVADLDIWLHSLPSDAEDAECEADRVFGCD